MVNLVIVSHSTKLAEGVAEILSQMAQGGCQIAVAGELTMRRIRSALTPLKLCRRLNRSLHLMV